MEKTIQAFGSLWCGKWRYWLDGEYNPIVIPYVSGDCPKLNTSKDEVLKFKVFRKAHPHSPYKGE